MCNKFRAPPPPPPGWGAALGGSGWRLGGAGRGRFFLSDGPFGIALERPVCTLLPLHLVAYLFSPSVCVCVRVCVRCLMRFRTWPVENSFKTMAACWHDLHSGLWSRSENTRFFYFVCFSIIVIIKSDLNVSSYSFASDFPFELTFWWCISFIVWQFLARFLDYLWRVKKKLNFSFYYFFKQEKSLRSNHPRESEIRLSEITQNRSAPRNAQGKKKKTKYAI